MEKILKLGLAVELVKNNLSLDDSEALEGKMACSIHEIKDGNHILITNPLRRATLVPLHSGERYNAYFFSGNKIYNAPIRVVKNITEGNFRIVEVELTGQLLKYERREFFRLDATIDVRYLVLTADNAAAFKEATTNGTLLQMEGFEDGITVDISGGGMRFTSGKQVQKNSMVITHMVAGSPSGEKKNYIFLGKVIKSEKYKDQRDRFEHRMQFVDMKQDAREEFVRFIFECERDRLKKHGGN